MGVPGRIVKKHGRRGYAEDRIFIFAGKCQKTCYANGKGRVAQHVSASMTTFVVRCLCCPLVAVIWCGEGFPSGIIR